MQIQNGGKIYIGIEDDGNVMGVNDTDALQLQVQNAIRDSIKPDITLFTNCYVEQIKGKDVVVIEIQKGTACPYYISSKGISPEGVFVRQGPSTDIKKSTAILILKEMCVKKLIKKIGNGRNVVYSVDFIN